MNRISKEVANAIRQATAEVGDGTALAGKIIRIVPGDETVYPPADPTETPYDCNLMLSEYSSRDRAGTDIRNTDLRAVIAADAGTEPLNDDILLVDGIRYGLSNVMPYKPGGVILYYTATARNG